MDSLPFKQTSPTHLSSLLFVHTDYLGSIIAETNEEGVQTNQYSYDAWGRPRNADDWTYTNAPIPDFKRGYTGHEHLEGLGLINMNFRFYDPHLGRFITPDNLVVDRTRTQSYNLYSYVLNNPLKYTDPTGNVIVEAIIIGAFIGAYSGAATANRTLDLTQWDWSSGKTWGGLAGGAVVGGLSAGFGLSIAGSGIVFAKTFGIMGSTFTNSVGMAIVNSATTGKESDVSISFGIGSYNFSKNEWGYLGKKGNNGLENFGYFMGAMGNLNDVNNLIDATKAKLITETKGESGIPHSAIQDTREQNLLSWGPEGTDLPPESNLGFAFKPRNATSDYPLDGSPQLDPINITVNKYIMKGIGSLDKVIKFQGATLNCANMAGIALWLNGIPNIPIHPYFLHASVWLYSSGIYNMLPSFIKR